MRYYSMGLLWLACLLLIWTVSGYSQNLVTFEYEKDDQSYTAYVQVDFFTSKDKEVTIFPQCEVPQLNFFGIDQGGVKVRFSHLKWADPAHAEIAKLVIRPAANARTGGLTVQTRQVILSEGKSREIKYLVSGEGEGQIRINLEVLIPQGLQLVGSVAQDYTIFNSAISVTKLEKDNMEESVFTPTQTDKAPAAVAEKQPSPTTKSPEAGTKSPHKTEVASNPQANKPVDKPETKRSIPPNPQPEATKKEAAADIAAAPVQAPSQPALQEEASVFPPPESPEQEEATLALASATPPADEPALSESETFSPIAYQSGNTSSFEATEAEMEQHRLEESGSGWGRVIMYLAGWPLLVLGTGWVIFLLGKSFLQSRRRRRNDALRVIIGKEKTGTDTYVDPEQEQPPQKIRAFDALLDNGNYIPLGIDALWGDSVVSSVFLHLDFKNDLEKLFAGKENAAQEVNGFLLGGHRYNDETEQFQVTLEKFVPFHPEPSSNPPALASQVLEEMNHATSNYPDLAVTGWISIRPGKTLELSARDQAIFQGLFARPYHVFVQVDPQRKEPEAAVYTRTRSGRMNMVADRLAPKWLLWPSPVGHLQS